MNLVIAITMKRLFNLLRSSRNQIECAFGRLKARWQILNTRINLKLENVLHVIYACFVLHNICSINGILVDDENLQRKIMHDRQMQPVVGPDLIYSCNSAEGISTRNTIVAFIKEHSEH